MRIWIFNHYAITPDQPGGTRHFDLGRELTRRGHDVTIFASSFHHYRRRYLRETGPEGWAIEEFQGVRFVWLRTLPYGRNDWRRAWGMLDYLRRSRRWSLRLCRRRGVLPAPDVVIGSSVHLLAALSGRLVATRFRVPFVMEVRDLWPQTLIDIGALQAGHPVARAMRLLERHLYRAAERIITPLPMAHEYIAASGVPADRVVWIPNGVDLSRYGDHGGDPSSGSFRVIYLGSHGPADELPVLLRAASIVQERGASDVRFVLMGDGPMKGDLIRMAREMGLANVEFADPVGKDRVPDVLRTVDATTFILPDWSLYRYGISLNKTFDYLAAAKPLILAGNPRNNIVVESGCGLSVPPADPGALAEAVIALRRMPEPARREMGRKGRAFLERTHDIRLLAGRLEDCLEGCLRGAGGRQPRPPAGRGGGLG
jgi:glycosyltransferase involved in cell wall biosynthesis